MRKLLHALFPRFLKRADEMDRFDIAIDELIETTARTTERMAAVGAIDATWEARTGKARRRVVGR
jgi:hypothetical protein